MIWCMPSISLSAVLNPEESGGYAALCPELNITSQGESIEQAMHNLKEAVEGFFEVASPAEIETRLKRPALFTHFAQTNRSKIKALRVLGYSIDHRSPAR